LGEAGLHSWCEEYISGEAKTKEQLALSLKVTLRAVDSLLKTLTKSGVKLNTTTIRRAGRGRPRNAYTLA
jgi:predicted ArsR family transcriptional regulator